MYEMVGKQTRALHNSLGVADDAPDDVRGVESARWGMRRWATPREEETLS